MATAIKSRKNTSTKAKANKNAQATESIDEQEIPAETTETETTEEKKRGPKAKVIVFDQYSVENPIFEGSGFTAEDVSSPSNLFDAAVREGVIDKPMANVMRAYYAPKDHPDYASFKDAAMANFPEEMKEVKDKDGNVKLDKEGNPQVSFPNVSNAMKTATTDLLKHLLHGVAYTNERRYKEAVEEQREGRGKRRTKAQIAYDKHIQTLEHAARKHLGISLSTPLLSLSQEDSSKIAEYVREHNTMTPPADDSRDDSTINELAD